MNVLEVVRFTENDLDAVYAIQREAFRPLYEKYRDDGTSPYLESRVDTLAKYLREDTQGYLIKWNDQAVGAVRIQLNSEARSARISALCVHPDAQGRGVAQQALIRIEQMHADVRSWNLDTIAQEAGNCHLYEKLGYRKSGKEAQLSENMTLLFYEKHL